MNSIGCKKPVLDALPEAILVNRIAEVFVSVAVVLAQWSSSHSELGGWRKVFQNLAPRAIFARAAAVTLIHDDEVEKVGRVFSVKAGATLVFRQCLIDGEVDLAALNYLPVFDFRACIAERGKDLILWVVDENIAIGEIENLRTAMLSSAVPARIPKLPADLKGDRRFTSPRRHRQKDAALASDDRFDCATDHNLLVITLALFKREIDRREELLDGGIAR